MLYRPHFLRNTHPTDMDMNMDNPILKCGGNLWKIEENSIWHSNMCAKIYDNL